MKCYKHPDVDAVGTCTKCGKSVCPSCSMNVGGQLVCMSCAEKMAGQTTYAAPTAGPSAQPYAAAPSPAGVNIKEPLLSLILSFLLPGLGQIYNGQIKKGIIAIVGYAIIIFAMIILSFILIGLCLIPVIFIVWLWGMYDAYTTANKINRGELVTDWLS